MDISAENEIKLNQLFRKDEFKKKETIFKNGDSNTKHHFIEWGLVRLYIIDKNGREFNVEFAKENQIIWDLATPAPTKFHLESIEATLAHSIEMNFKGDFNSTLDWPVY